MTFGVLTICYDHGRYLGQAIESVQAQYHRDWRMVVVDDRSTDDSLVQGLSRSGLDARLTVVQHVTNAGMGAASATAMRYMPPEVTHVAVLDADDVLTPDALQIMATAWFRHPDAVMIYSRHQRCDVDLKLCTVDGPWQSAPLPAGYTRLDGYRNGGVPDAAGVVQRTTVGPLRTFSRAAYDRTAGFGPYRGSQDFDITMKLEEVGPLVHVPDVLYRYRFDAAAHARHPNCMAEIAAEAAKRREKRVP